MPPTRAGCGSEPSLIAGELEKLARMGCQAVRISDEMFFLNRRYYEPLLQQVVERDLGLRMWPTSRVDTVRPVGARAVQSAGIGWLALGIEAGSQMVRKKSRRAAFRRSTSARSAPRCAAPASTSSATTSPGFPDDTLETMQQTLDLAPRAQHRDGQHVPVPGVARQPDVPTGGSQRLGFARELCRLRLSHRTTASRSRPPAALAPPMCCARDAAWQRYPSSASPLTSRRWSRRKFGAQSAPTSRAMAKIKRRAQAARRLTLALAAEKGRSRAACFIADRSQAA